MPTKKPNQKSYTSRMLDVLQENKCPKKYLDIIKQFAADEAEKREQEKEATKGTMTFGKYKTKLISDVYKLDPQYVSWLKRTTNISVMIIKELLTNY